MADIARDETAGTTGAAHVAHGGKTRAIGTDPVDKREAFRERIAALVC